MKTVLSISGTDYLFPDVTSATKVLALLETATVCCLIGDTCQIGEAHDYEAKLELTVLRAKHKFIKRKQHYKDPDEPMEIASIKPRAKRALASTPRFLLEG